MRAPSQILGAPNTQANSQGHTQREPDEPESPPPAAEPRAPSLKPGQRNKVLQVEPGA